MDEFTKRKIKRALVDNPELSVRMVIQAIRFNKKHRLYNRTPYRRNRENQG